MTIQAEQTPDDLLNPAEESFEAMDAAIQAKLSGTVQEIDAPVATVEAESIPAPNAEPESAPKDDPAFVGKYTAAQVESLLAKLESFEPASVVTDLERKLSGHLGPLGARLKTLEAGLAKEWDTSGLSEALEGVKEIDEGLYAALLAGLQKGLKVQAVDPMTLFQPALEETLSSRDAYFQAMTSDAVEERLLQRFVPDAYDVAKSPEWAVFVKGLKADEQEALVNWAAKDAEGRALLGMKNAEPVIGLFDRFKAGQQKVLEAQEAKKKIVAQNVRPARSGGSPTTAPAVDDAESAIQAALDRRLRERLNNSPTPARS